MDSKEVRKLKEGFLVKKVMILFVDLQNEMQCIFLKVESNTCERDVDKWKNSMLKPK